MLYLHNFTGIYKKQDSYKNFAHKLFEDEKLTGTRGYLEDGARAYLENEIRDNGRLSALHFLDSGNYHHLSRVYIDRIKFKFDLIVYDNHTDMQFSAFGNILSCGSWIADAYGTLEYLDKIFIVGAESRYIEACYFNNDERVIFADSILNVEKVSDNPVYISIDKDVLSKDEFVSDWDQGSMSIASLIKELSYINGNFSIIGADVCGEPDINDDININLSNNINKELANIFVDIF